MQACPVFRVEFLQLLEMLQAVIGEQIGLDELDGDVLVGRSGIDIGREHADEGF